MSALVLVIMITLCFRIQQAKCEQLPIVDVDGSYLYRKQQSLMDSGVTVAPLDPPAPPLSGWQTLTETNARTIAPMVPLVTSGMYCWCIIV